MIWTGDNISEIQKLYIAYVGAGETLTIIQSNAFHLYATGEKIKLSPMSKADMSRYWDPPLQKDIDTFDRIFKRLSRRKRFFTFTGGDRKKYGMIDNCPAITNPDQFGYWTRTRAILDAEYFNG